MKRFSFSLVAVMVTLMVLAASCSMPMGATGGYYEEDAPVRGNVYYSQPYGSNVIVVERDPYTGRYYEVSPYGRSYGNVYGNSYPYRNNRRVYNNGGAYNRNYDRNNVQQRQQQQQQRVEQLHQQQEQRRETVRQMDNSKESILGKKKD